jgi:hypothetical protein
VLYDKTGGPVARRWLLWRRAGVVEISCKSSLGEGVMSFVYTWLGGWSRAVGAL